MKKNSMSDLKFGDLTQVTLLNLDLNKVEHINQMNSHY